MGKFINTSYINTVDGMTNINRNILDNPYYMFNNSKATKVIYYQIDDINTTLDDSARIAYSNLGKDSPFRFNRIDNYLLYGLEKIALSLDFGDKVLSADAITVEAIALPNLLIPRPGEYFEIPHIKDSNWLFLVTDVQKDTLDNSANIYKLSYKLQHSTNVDILPLVTEEYTTMVNNIGTEYRSIISKDVYNKIEELENITDKLKTYYKALFYDNSTQTFTYSIGDNMYLYDEYLIEFIRKHKIMDFGSDNSKYLLVEHKLPLGKTFMMEYDNTIFNAIDKRDPELLSDADYLIIGIEINNPISLFSRSTNTYYRAIYLEDGDNRIPMSTGSILPSLSSTVINAIIGNTNLTLDDAYLNLIIRYMNKEILTKTEFDNLNTMKFKPNRATFYHVPILSYCIEEYIKELMV